MCVRVCVNQINIVFMIRVVEQPFVSLQNPHFPKRIKIDKGIEEKIVLLEYKGNTNI